jgi:hypothetical protein
MARIHPDGWNALEATGAAARRVETLERLARLPDAYSVYHGVHWSRSEADSVLFGSIDFAVVGPGGDVLLIEQAPGFLEETPRGLCKRSSQTEKHLPSRLARVRDAVAARLRGLLRDAPTHVDGLLYCPDYHVKDPGSAGIDPTRIVDAARRAELPERILDLLPARPAHPERARIQRFFADELSLVADAGAVIGQSQVLYTRLAGGLTHWARRVDCRPFRLRVVGTAGSGKTQLALRVLDDAIAAGRRPLYVCYNRPLADHIAQIAPAGCVVSTYHQLCDRIQRSQGCIPDFGEAGAFRRLEAYFAAFPGAPEWRFDELIVDEGQDIQADWVEPLMRLLSPDGRAWWLEDPLQNLYGRPAPALSGWVSLRADTNYRSPRAIVALADKVLGGAPPLTAGSPITGPEVEILGYASADEMLERTKTAVTRGLGAGFKKDGIALITFRGREHSHFTGLRRLGPHSLRAFTGEYDLLGTPVYDPGELLVESVYRFKGRSAPCVILTEVDFDSLDDTVRRKLFVGMTRATLKLIVVAAEAAAAELRALARDA